MPEINSRLQQARSDYSAAQSDPRVANAAGGELKEAGETLDRANRAWDKREDAAVVERLADLADQEVSRARETARWRDSNMNIADANTDQEQARLEAKARAARSAESAQLRSETWQRQVDLQEQAASDARINAELATLPGFQQSLDTQARSPQSEQRFWDLETKHTDSGLAITLGDVLFDSNRSQLKSGGRRDVQEVADFLQQYPLRTVRIESHTDSSGIKDRDQELSERRAASVRVALLDMGIATDRIALGGYSESYPGTGHNTVAGQQLNRRVEIIISEDGGKTDPR